MERRSLDCGTWLLALTWSLAARANAMPVTLVADTHVNAARPSVNSGGISNIDIGGGYTGLLQFDLGGLPAGTSAAQVSRAVLRLYVNQMTMAGSVNVLPVTAPWSEFAVTYQTMPPTGSVAGVFSVTQAGAYVTVDVTALVQGWLAAPATNVGLALTGMTAVAQFDSKENDLTGHAPALDVELLGQAGLAGAPGLPGVAGASGPAGAAGAVGQPGIAGPQGVSGAVGATGTSGPAGLSGAQGSAGPAGAIGPAGALGPVGTAGPAGKTGASGVQGAAGSAGPPVSFHGPWTAGLAYAVGDAVSFGGSSYGALGANSGQQPDQAPGLWALLAQAGVPGTAGAQGPIGSIGASGPAGSQGIAGPAGSIGATGSSGPAGPSGATGVQGVAGAPGAAGATGLTFHGPWAGGYGYVANDAVTYSGSTWLALAANHSVAPGSDPSSWTVLAVAGGAGPTGPSGTAAAVTVGTVTTGAAGSGASVVNSGSSSAAVLNFTIPQGATGAPGTGSGTGTAGPSGIPFASMFHAVSYAATFYSLNNTNQSASETAHVLTWVPDGCLASKLVVYSQQAATITVMLRYGSPGNMINSALTCQVATKQSCTATGAESIPAGSFVDLEIDHADSNPVGVWTAVSCN